MSKLLILVGIVLAVGLFAQTARAAAPAAGQDYTVQLDDRLNRLADKFYGEPAAAAIIIDATNARAAEIDRYQPIAGPDEITPGQTLFIPALSPGELMAQLTPTGPTPEQQTLLTSLPVKGTPPELFNEVWLNSSPLKLADLHGKVVLLEFWTFGCYNCKNVIPSLREWHQNYAADGLVIIGVHTPEFGYEQELDNVKEALVQLDVQYPVAIDNDWQTWQAYKAPFNQRYWPSKYFIDKAGNVRHIHIGEGDYARQEEIIKALLAENL